MVQLKISIVYKKIHVTIGSILNKSINNKRSNLKINIEIGFIHFVKSLIVIRTKSSNFNRKLNESIMVHYHL